MDVKFRRIYQSDRGWWRCEIERDGKVEYFSLRTKDEREANRKAEKYIAQIAPAQPIPGSDD